MNENTVLPVEKAPAAVREALRRRILTVRPAEFEALALDVFRYQAQYNPLYRTYLHYRKRNHDPIRSLDQLPFLPIGFFRNHTVVTASAATQNPVLTFASSGTTGERTSQHHLADPELYDAVSRRIFEQVYGPLDQFHILALLPSYLERNNSSLVYMVQRFIQLTGSRRSGFYLQNTDELTQHLRDLAAAPDGRQVLLLGVTFALLDWAESGTDFSFLQKLPGLMVMETGGMKGRRRELLREEVHQILTQRLGLPVIHSEYGMTELLSQAYSTGEGVFRPSPTLRILLRDINDPFHLLTSADRRTTGGINVIDLANLDSCSFLETQDLGQFTPDGFRVIGRFDNSDLRGCNLLVG